MLNLVTINHYISKHTITEDSTYLISATYFQIVHIGGISEANIVANVGNLEYPTGNSD